MTKSDKKHELASPSNGLRALRDRLEATGAPVSAVRIRNAQRTTILVLDASLSMAGSETEVRRGALSFASEALPASAVGVIRFGSRVSVDIAPSRVGDDVRRACSSYRADLGGTTLAPALEAAEGLLGTHRARTIVVVSDGVPADSTQSIAVARAIRDRGVRIVAIGTTGADAAFLAAIAGDPARSTLVSRDRLAMAITDVTRLLR